MHCHIKSQALGYYRWNFPISFHFNPKFSTKFFPLLTFTLSASSHIRLFSFSLSSSSLASQLHDKHSVNAASISAKLTPLMQHVMKIIYQNATCQYKILLSLNTIVEKTNKTTEAESHETNLDKVKAYLQVKPNTHILDLRAQSQETRYPHS